MQLHKGLATFSQYEEEHRDREGTGGKADETCQGWGGGRGSMGNITGFEHDCGPNAVCLAHPWAQLEGIPTGFPSLPTWAG